MLSLSLRGMFACLYTRGELRAAFELAEQELVLAEKINEFDPSIWAHFGLGVCSHWKGEFERARRELETACALYDPKKPSSTVFSSQVAPSVNCNINLGWVLWILGFPDQADEQVNFAV